MDETEKLRIQEKGFCEDDPYNPGNVIRGTMYQDERRYGELVIHDVGTDRLDQVIKVTPKFRYPGNRDGPFVPFTKKDFEDVSRFPCRIYEKIDGTNICMYHYIDASGRCYTSFKTRLSPFCRKNTYNDFFKLWNESAIKYSGYLKELREMTDFNFAFEMYGTANKILLDYNIRIDCRLLYAIDRITGAIIDPAELCPYNKFPKARLVDEISLPPEDDGTFYLELYDRTVEKLESQHMMEGCMFYFTKPDNTAIVLKCKPKWVLEEAGCCERISDNEIKTMMYNALELIPFASAVLGTGEWIEKTKELAAETFEPARIEKSVPAMERIADEIKKRMKTDNAIREAYTSIEKTKTGIRWVEGDKTSCGVVMRELSKMNTGIPPTEIYNAMKRMYG